MGFQTTVNTDLALCVPGKIIQDGPTRSQSRMLGSSAGYVARYHTIDTSTGKAQLGGTIGSGIIAGGIAVMPEDSPLYGDSASNLTPTLTLPANTQVNLLQMGTVGIYAVAAVTDGDTLIYNTTDGTLKGLTPGGSVPAGWAAVPGGVIYQQTNAAAGLAKARLTN